MKSKYTHKFIIYNKKRIENNYGRLVEKLIEFDSQAIPKDFLESINKWFTPEECAKIEKGIYSGCKLDIAYTLSINDFRGSRNLEFFIKEYDKSN